MAIVALLIAGHFAVYSGFFYLLALALRMGVPLDALRAGLYRAGLGLAGTLFTLVVHIILRLANVSLEAMLRAGEGVLWAARLGAWVSVLTWVYRVTRWRKWKLAVGAAAGLALNVAIDTGLARLSGEFVPAFGSWIFRFC